MSQTTSLLKAMLLDGEGGGQKLGWKEINNWQPEQGTLWVHLNLNANQTHTWLRRGAKLHNVTRHALLAEETRPRTIMTDGGLLMILRGVNLNPGQDPEDMISVRLWLDANRIITIGAHHMLSIDDLEIALENRDGPKTTTDFLMQLIEKLSTRIGDVVNDIEDQVDELEEKVQSETTSELRSQLAEVRRQAIVIRRYLAPQRDAMSRLQLDNSGLIDTDHQLHVREALDRLMRFIEDLDSLRDRAAVIHEELMSRLSEQLNNRMYSLSIIAAIFLPLTFITGLLGINVGGIPGSKSDDGFAIVCILLIIMFVGTFWLFRRNKWMSD